MKTIYYYQTFVGLDKLLTHAEDIDVVIISSIHFGKSKIFLNDNNPNDKLFDKVWYQTENLHNRNTTILLMIGGAGGAYNNLFNDFENNYNLLKELLEQKTWIDGIDLDIEESVDINNVKMLMDRLINDFGEDFIITMAPLSSSLQNDGSSMGNFNYKDLYKSKQGKYINWFNTQCYDSFSEETFDSIIKNGYPANKIVMGMESGQFNEKTFKNAISTLTNIKNKYNINGVFDWEYLDAPPSKTDPSLWCRILKKI